MNNDERVPCRLMQTQKWFGGIISQPMGENSSINPITPFGNKISIEAEEYLLPGPKLKAWERIEIYNQQYWWRLLKILQDLYPTLLRLFGYEEFNKMIAVPYLDKYPSNHWSIDHIGDRLPLWIEEDYQEEDKSLVLDAGKIDYIIAKTFSDNDGQPIPFEKLDSSDIEHLVNRKLYLQPWITLFSLPYDLFRFRDKMLDQDVEYWIENDFPLLEQSRNYFFIVYRDWENNVVWDELEKSEYQVLLKFQQGSSIAQACDWLEKQEQKLCAQAAAHIHFWFKEWTLKNWLTLG